MMDPGRWSEITGSFALERGEKLPENSQLAKSSCTDTSEKVKVETHLGNRRESIDVILRDIAANSGCLSEENLKIITTLKAIIQEKEEKLRCQEEIISSLRTKNGPRNSANTQTDSEDLRESFSPRHSTAAVNSSEITSVVENSSGNGKELEIVKSKIEGLEMKLDALLAFIQSQFPKFPVDCGNGSSKIPGSTTTTYANQKPWNKPPLYRAKPTSGSILREAYCRNRGSTNSNRVGGGGIIGGSHDVSLGNKISSCGHIAYSAAYGAPDQDYQTDEIEQRLQFLESVVAQMKAKYMRVIACHRR